MFSKAEHLLIRNNKSPSSSFSITSSSSAGSSSTTSSSAATAASKIFTTSLFKINSLNDKSFYHCMWNYWKQKQNRIKKLVTYHRCMPIPRVKKQVMWSSSFFFKTSEFQTSSRFAVKIWSLKICCSLSLLYTFSRAFFTLRKHFHGLLYACYMLRYFKCMNNM